MSGQRIVIIGAGGQLGTALSNQYPDATALDSTGLDITDSIAVRNFDWSNADVIINAAAYTNVDGAETAEGRPIAWKVNAVGVRNLAEAAQQHDLTLFHLSSEYVFDGTQKQHREDEPFSPLGVYAQSKAAGDIVASVVPRHYILRTSWVIGEGKNFVRSIMGLAAKDISPNVVADQFGRLTFTSELTRAIDHLIVHQPAYGTYNLTNSGDVVSWADVAREVYTNLGRTDLHVGDTTAAEYFAGKVSSPRPVNSDMDLGKIQATGFEPRDWREDLKAYVESQGQPE